MSTKNLLSTILDDASGVTVVKDAVGIREIKGIGIQTSMPFRLTIVREDVRTEKKGVKPNSTFVDTSNKPSNRPLYSGTITLLSPDGETVFISEVRKQKKEAKNKEYSNKDVYATEKCICNSSKLEDLLAEIRKRIDKLILENSEYYLHHLKMRLTPDAITPALAVNMYLDDFCRNAYKDTEKATKNRKTIETLFLKLQNIPICKITSRTISKFIKTENITEKQEETLYLFFEYMLSRGLITGKNPFSVLSRQERSAESRNKSAFAPTTIGFHVFEAFVDLLNEKLSTLHCVIMLLLSGFTLAEIQDLYWKDIEFVKGYDDFAIVHIRKEHLRVAKHDYSRPALVDTAKYLNRVYQALCNNTSPDVLANTSITGDFDTSAIAIEVNNLLVLAGYTDPLSVVGRPSDKVDPIPIRLLRSNYRRMLVTYAGLANDADTLNFLCGTVLKNTTYINYESHTSPEAMKRLYTILKPVSKTTVLRQVVRIRKIADGYVFTATPRTNHELAQIIGSLKLLPGETIRIVCPHGIIGSLKMIDGESSAESNSNETNNKSIGIQQIEETTTEK